MTFARPHPLYPGAAIFFALLGFLERPIAAVRPAPAGMGTSRQLFVTSENDNTGLGSLRWAIFAAATAPGRVSIQIDSKRIVLKTALPPVLNPAGVVLAAAKGVEIDGSAVSAGPLLEIDSPGSVVSGLTLRGAVGQGILVHSSGVALRGLSFMDCVGEGVHVLAGAGAVTIEGSTFDRNGTGIGVDPGAGVDIRGSHFRKHDRAAVWAVSSTLASSGSVSIVGNHFEEDRMSLVLIHVPAQVADNQFLRPVEAAAYLTGAPVVIRNRVDAGESMGIYVDAADGAWLEENEVSNCLAVGILLRQSRNIELRRNRVFGNGYGIAVVLDGGGGPSVIADNLVLRQQVDGVFVVGASPVVHDNQVLGNRQAGLRILDYIPLRGRRLAGLPVVRGNVFRENRWDQLRGEYREPPEAKPRP